MKQPRPITKRVRNHQGRIDVLACKLITEVVRRQQNPVMQALHDQLMPTLLEPLANYYLGPRNARARHLARVMRQLVPQPGTIRRVA